MLKDVFDLGFEIMVAQAKVLSGFNGFNKCRKKHNFQQVDNTKDILCQCISEQDCETYLKNRQN